MKHRRVAVECADGTVRIIALCEGCMHSFVQRLTDQWHLVRAAADLECEFCSHEVELEVGVQ